MNAQAVCLQKRKKVMRSDVNMRIRRCGQIILLGIFVMMMLTGCAKTSNVKQKSGLGAGGDAANSAQMEVLAVVKAVDQKNQSITLYDTATQEEQTFSYNGGTQILSKNKVQMVVSQLSCGEIVNATYEADRKELVKVQISKDAWEYKNIRSWSIDRSAGLLTVTGRQYQYDTDLAVFYGNKEEMLIDLNQRDQLNIKGIGNKIYSLQVTRGHGYIRLGGHDLFLGGSIEVDQDIFMKVENNMLITVGEGEHTVVFRNGSMQAKKTIVVKRDEESFLDMSEYKPEADKEGKIRFVITPSDAVLYVNGKVRNQNRLISLKYGNYAITVKAEGYEDYTGILRVQESKKSYETVYIDLVAEKEEQNNTSTTKQPSATSNPKVTPSATVYPGGSNAPAITATPTVKEDSKHTITVKSPKGASVYVDGVYKGVAPVSFTKIIGDFTITLSKTGCVTKSYSVTTDDDNEDVEYSFAALQEKE